MLCLLRHRFITAFHFPVYSSCSRYLNSKIPNTPFQISNNESKNYRCRTKIDNETVARLERLSLVDFGNEKGIKILEDAIAFADQITTVNTDGVEPLVTVLENRELRLREDIVTEGNCCKEVLSNASVIEEDYFVAPPGNIPVSPKTYPTKTEIENDYNDPDNKDKLKQIQSVKLEKLLEVCRKHGFIKAIRLTNLPDNQPDCFHFGPAGELLAQNIQREWIFSNVTAREPNSVFQHYSPGSNNNKLRLKDAYTSCKTLTNGQLPFGLVEVRSDSNEENLNKTDDVNCIPKRCNTLRYYAFIGHEEGPQFFYRWQQHRHMWWRKFSVDPGRFSLAESKNGKELKVEIKANFPWGLMTVETIENHGVEFFSDLSKHDSSDFSIADGRKRCLPYVVESFCTLETATFVFLCDGFRDSEGKGVTKQHFHLHRKLAPFKMSFAASPTTSENNEEISNLASYLSQELRHAGVITLLPHLRGSLNAQLARCGVLAVPYTLILDSATLNTGLAKLRSQQTSLEEDIHISSLVSYFEQLMKNY